MSIKSHFSAEDLQDNWDRSITLDDTRSSSDDSLFCADESEYLALELLKALSPPIISRLRRSFQKTHSTSTQDVHRRVEKIMRQAAAEEGIQFAEPEPLRDIDKMSIDEVNFVASIEKLFGGPKFSPHAAHLFHLLDPFSTHRVLWGDLLDKLVSLRARYTRSRAERWKEIPGGQRIEVMEHCKRETIVKMVSIRSDETFCYAVVSKGGRVGLYSGDLKLITQYELWYHRTGVKKRVKNSWVTDAIFMNDVQYLVICASDRSMSFYEASTSTHILTYCITGMREIPSCLAYSPSSPELSLPTSELMIGDCRGQIFRMQFLNIRISLFYNCDSHKINWMLWSELFSPPHTSYTSISLSRPHTRTVRRVIYCGRRDVTASCSNEGGNSIILRYASGCMKSYVFSVPRGITCCVVIPHLHIVVGGSQDGQVRVWTDTQPSPTSVLMSSSRAAVLDVTVLVAKRNVVCGFNSALCLDIWDLYEECLLQTIKVNFPFLGVLGKKADFGTYSIYPGPPCRPPWDVDSVRRRSGVCRGTSGGLVRRDVTGTSLTGSNPDLEWSSILVTCCDHVLVVELSEEPRGDVYPPPLATREAKRPEQWNLEGGTVLEPLLSESRKQKLKVPELTLPMDLLSVKRSDCEDESHSQDLDLILEKAGLKEILKKDFVLTMGLKHDLNKKMAKLEKSMERMSGPVNAVAPFLALTLHHPADLNPGDEMIERYNDVISLFGGSRSPASVSTPRSTRSSVSTRSKLHTPE